MKSRLLSVYKSACSGETCVLCAIMVTVVFTIVLWQVTGLIIDVLQDKFPLDNIAYWRPAN